MIMSIRSLLEKPREGFLGLLIAGMIALILVGLVMATCPTAPDQDVEIKITDSSDNMRSVFCTGEAVTLKAKVTCTAATPPPPLFYCWESPTNLMGTTFQTITFIPRTPRTYQAMCTVTGIAHFVAPLTPTNMPFAGKVTTNAFVAAAISGVNVHSSDPETFKTPSVLPASANPFLHFVTARQQGDIVLEASVTPDTPEVRNAISWTTSTPGVTLTSPAIGTDKRTVKLSSNFPQGKKVFIRIRIGGISCKEILVWVVSADKRGAVTRAFVVPITAGPVRIGTRVFTVILPKFMIQPTTIITETDRPDLTGSDVPPRLPGRNTCRNPLANGVNARWDESRRIAIRARTNPTSLEGRLACQDFDDDFPANPVTGNDDASTGDPEDNDPYTSPDAGSVTGSDMPTRQFGGRGGYPAALGSVGDTYRSRLWFQEFARIQLGPSGSARWFVISDQILWRVDFRFKKVQPPTGRAFWDDDGSDVANDNAGAP